MKTLLCRELCNTNCGEPISGNDVAELKRNTFLHLGRAHSELALTENQRQIAEKIDVLFPMKTKI